MKDLIDIFEIIVALIAIGLFIDIIVRDSKYLIKHL